MVWKEWMVLKYAGVQVTRESMVWLERVDGSKVCWCAGYEREYGCAGILFLHMQTKNRSRLDIDLYRS